MPPAKTSDVDNLEMLWSGQFGDQYVERNVDAGRCREAFWKGILEKCPVQSALEVGCNVGANLEWIAKHAPETRLVGVDINRRALTEVHSRLPGTKVLRASARQLPFADGSFDLVFTVGVLIHQPPIALPIVMGEIVRCVRRFVLCAEYHAAEPTEVIYRGQRGALFKRDFGGLYAKLFSELRLLQRGFLSREEGWDDVTFWLFERGAA